jgi:hypothetical protein
MMNYANAQNLASYGRGNDTELIHMTPGEVKGLQALALAHGGSLTINPETGLPEAGFLERILPMVIGAGLTVASGGALTPLMAAGITGAGYGLATGSVEKGLMAGIGAYGGAGLGAGLTSAGTSSLVNAGGEEAVKQAIATTGQEAASQAAGQTIAGEAAKTAALEGITLPANYAELAAQSATPQQIAGIQAQNALANNPALQQAASQAANPLDVVRASGMGNVANSAQVVNPTVGQSVSNMGRGLTAGPSSIYNSLPSGTLPAVAMTALTPDTADTTQAGYQEDEYDRRLKGYKLSPDYQAYVAPRPNPYYRPTYAAEGGVMNSFDDESGVDMASGGIARYRNKGKTNVMQDYLDRQEKEQAQMQKHLSTNPSSYFPDVGIFRDPDIDTARKDALTASMIRLGKAGKGAGIKAVPLPKTSIRGLGDVRGATPEIEEAAEGGVMGYNLGGYSDGGRMLEGPGDGMSDSIPASIAGKQPARLADGEFVVPADVVSHLGNGSTDAGAKKLYKMMDKIRMARTGTKKQAPEVNADKYLPVKTAASGGIAGYASGGVIGYAEGGDTGAKDIARVYETYLGRTPSASEIKSWQDTGASFETISQGIRKSEEASAFVADKKNAEKIVSTLYEDQLGRKPDADGLKFWSESLASGTPLQEISQGINQSLEGQNFDTQYITSLYRQNLARNPEQAGFQWWKSMAQDAGYTPKELEAILKQSATVEQAGRNIVPGTVFTEMELAALESDPFGGRYATKSIYDLLPDAVNVSTIGNRKAQFVNPVTQQSVVSNFGNNTWSQASGEEVLNIPQVQAAINVARSNGTLTETGFNSLITDLRAAKTPEQTRAAFAKPQAQVVIDALYGQQIGEDVDLGRARLEAEGRQGVLNANDTGYYQDNRVLSDAYQQAGLTVPFNYNAYKGVDTRTGQADLFTPGRFQDKQRDLINTLNRNNPYRTSYQPINRGIANMPASVRDPYSDEGLAFLYGQMMDQYAPAPPGQVNPATFVSNAPYTYIPPPINNLTLNNPISDASKPVLADVIAATPVVADAGATGGKAGGLMAIDRKKRAKDKTRKGLKAA